MRKKAKTETLAYAGECNHGLLEAIRDALHLNTPTRVSAVHEKHLPGLCLRMQPHLSKATEDMRPIQHTVQYHGPCHGMQQQQLAKRFEGCAANTAQCTISWPMPCSHGLCHGLLVLSPHSLSVTNRAAAHSAFTCSEPPVLPRTMDLADSLASAAHEMVFSLTCTAAVLTLLQED